MLAWLVAGDPAVARAVRRHLLGEPLAEDPDLATVPGDVAAILAARQPSGHWGQGFYQPKWTSTHYSLLELADLGLSGTDAACTASVRMLLRAEKGRDGGLNPAGSVQQSDVCINAMALCYCSHFGAPVEDLRSLIDFVLGQQLPDGGFNCRSNRSGASHSSMHTTVCVLEGLTAYERGGYRHAIERAREASTGAAEFLLRHRLFRSHRTGEPIHPEFAKLHHPVRWHFDVLRGLLALAESGVVDDPRLGDAVQVLVKRRRPDGRWAANRGYPGATHIAYPRAGEPNRWVTLNALRVLRACRGQAQPMPA